MSAAPDTSLLSSPYNTVAMAHKQYKASNYVGKKAWWICHPGIALATLQDS